MLTHVQKINHDNANITGTFAPSCLRLLSTIDFNIAVDLKVNNDVKFLNMFASICELLIQAKQRTMALKFDLHSSNATEFVSLNLFTRRLASIAAIICALNLKK